MMNFPTVYKPISGPIGANRGVIKYNTGSGGGSVGSNDNSGATKGYILIKFIKY
ncbi:hypothetical protein DICPUDRAFT_160292 [Dictyostelium purpureum]|uniref:Uncharacterized protein n=1 Tax=Dictyostelium purpureum TaxID=5786 RepID=F1A631_DICPU|nr:uncharacterized protein DICPUDRAFT_160292 [Dictyostelium purpureum]EGC28348.1 hypothetical protein DICPUDRAFT_160292 [Dictyostelium purpureum]|eukprot:XP_003295125.1 hypothetical protein DICPUDRAFT_160292 [Dictyostelium purpureum]